MYGVDSGLLTGLPIQTGVYITGWCGMQEEEWDAGCRCAVRRPTREGQFSHIKILLSLPPHKESFAQCERYFPWFGDLTAGRQTGFRRVCVE